MSSEAVHAIHGEVRAWGSPGMVRPLSACDEALARHVVESACDAIVTVDARQRIVLFNGGAERLFGYRAREVLGQPLDVLLPLDARLRHRGHVRAFGGSDLTQRRMGHQGSAIVGRHRDGAEFPVDVSISCSEREGERYFTAVLRDAELQQRREAEQRFLAEVGAVLATALEDELVALDAVAELAVASELADCCVVDLVEPDGTRLRHVSIAHRDVQRSVDLARFVNHTVPLEAESLCARTAFLGRPTLVTDLDPAASRALAEASGPCELLRELAPHSLLVVPLVAGNREVLGAIGFANSESPREFSQRDLWLTSELAWRVAMTIQNARLHRQARDALRARDRVLGLVAHDLRSPLGTILICTQLLEHELPAELGLRDEVQQTLALARRTVQRMDRLIHDLLDVAALEAGRLVLDREPVPPARLLDETAAVLRPRAESVAVTIEITGRPESPCVLADTDRILRVLCNLVDNAVKFTPGGGSVTLGAQLDGTEIRFSVHDTGPGIAPQHSDRLFEPFWQADPEDGRGVGLGLPICKEIIEGHGGRIGVASTPGRGATFWFTLPSAVEAARFSDPVPLPES